MWFWARAGLIGSAGAVYGLSFLPFRNSKGFGRHIKARIIYAIVLFMPNKKICIQEDFKLIDMSGKR